MNEDNLKNYWQILIYAIIFLNIIIILILIYKKYTLTVTQQQNCPPPQKESPKPQPQPQPIIIQFFINFYATIKITFEIALKIVLPWTLIISILLSFLEFCGVDIGFLDYIKKHLNIMKINQELVTNEKSFCNSDYKTMKEKQNEYIYDTDPKIDAYIKGSLNLEQLVILDKILEYEKLNSISRISSSELKSLTSNNRALMDAYLRWIECKNLIRNTNHVVYPSERKFFYR